MEGRIAGFLGSRTRNLVFRSSRYHTHNGTRTSTLHRSAARSNVRSISQLVHHARAPRSRISSHLHETQLRNLCSARHPLIQSFKNTKCTQFQSAPGAAVAVKQGLGQTRFLSTALSQKQQKSSSPVESQNDDLTSPDNKTPIPTILTRLNPLAKKERKENIYTLPNFLTFSRLIAAPAIGYAILTSHPHLALGLFAYAGITDLVDGYLARRFNSQTVVGTILDPMADKTLMTIVVVCLTVQGILPPWLAVIVLGRDIALAISAIYFRWISLPAPKTFARYWDFSLPSAEVHPTEISKINTFLQLLLVGNAMVLPALPVAVVDAWNLYGVFEGWQYLVAGTTVWSGLSYVFSKDAVKILTEQEVKDKQREIAEKQTASKE